MWVVFKYNRNSVVVTPQLPHSYPTVTPQLMKVITVIRDNFVISITLRLLLYQHILLLVAVEPQTEVGNSFLENLQEVCLHLRIERELAILCLVETAL